MISFRGNALETTVPVMIEDVVVSPIRMSVTSRQRPTRAGADFVRIVGGTRTVTITFGLLTNDRRMRQEQLRQITRWARSEQEDRLTLPDHDGLYLQCICTELPEAALRKWWDGRLRIVFTCFDNPYWTDIAEKTAACGTQFTALGDAPPIMRITRTLTATAQAQTYGNGAESMTFANIPAGDMVIDLNRQTAAVDGASIMQHYTFASTFLTPRTGTQTITGTGTVRWRERWE